jgi:hypothetical protein
MGAEKRSAPLRGALRFPFNLMMKATFRSLLVLIVLGFGILPALQPLFSGQLFGTDGALHFHRVAQLERALRSGILYPRWAPDLGLGFGFPLFNYYAPLSYYFVLPLRWMGFSLSTAFSASLGLALWGLALAMYLWVRDLWGELAGIVAAFAAIYAPTTLNYVYQWSALPGMEGLLWLVFTFWSLRRLAVSEQPRFGVLTALGCAAMILSHNVTALIGIALLLAYVALCALLYGPRSALRAGCFLASGIGLSAFFWLPAFFEKNFVHIYQLYSPSVFDYHNHFRSLREILASPRPVDYAQANFAFPVSLGWVQAALALIAWWPLSALIRREVRAHRWALTLATGVLVGLVLPISLPVWERVPLMQFFQFPWRFLIPASLGLAALAGLGATVLARRGQTWIPLVVGGMMIFALPWLFPLRRVPQSDPSPLDQIRFEMESGLLGTTAAGEYLPIWVQEIPSPEALLPLYEAAAPDFIIPRLDLTSLPAGARVLEARYGLTQAHLTLESDQPFRIRFLWYFFPGWQGWLDGQPLPLEPDGPHGLIAADIPAGRHTVTVVFGETPLRRWAWRLSGLSAPLLLLAVLWTGRRRRETSPLSPPFGGPLSLRVLGVCALLAVGLTVVKTLYLDRYDNPFRRTLFDGRQVRGVDVPLEVNFGNQMVLMGYDLPTPAVRADEPLEVILYWRVLPPVNTDYSVGLHLVDERGILYGQQDNMHPAYPYPTSRLHPNQYARDPHFLTPWEGTPPGRYTLLVIVYGPDGRRLDLRDGAGNPLGTTAYPLAQVEIRRPWRFPPPERLPTQTRLEAEVGGHLRLVGIGPLPEAVEVGQPFLLTLFWQAVERPDGAYRARLCLRGTDGTVVAEAMQTPGRADVPTSSWTRGELVRDVWSFLVPVALPTDPKTPVPAGTYALHLDLIGEDGAPVAPGVDIGALRVTVPERTFTAPPIPHPVGLRLGEWATLLGHGPLPAALRPGETFSLVLYWRADGLIPRSYTVFVHLVGPDGRIYAQQDAVPGGWTRPTTGWFPGEFLRDEYRLTVDPSAPPGTYILRVGWYDPATGQRVPVLDETGAPLGDFIPLPATAEVQP